MKVIEIVGEDYYDNSNPHVVLLEGVDIETEHAKYRALHYTEQRTPTEGGLGYTYDFGSWLVHHNKARWPDDSEFDTFQE